MATATNPLHDRPPFRLRSRRSPSGREPTIVIVEDEAIRDLLAFKLEAAGYRTRHHR